MRQLLLRWVQHRGRKPDTNMPQTFYLLLCEGMNIHDKAQGFMRRSITETLAERTRGKDSERTGRDQEAVQILDCLTFADVL